MSFFTVVSLSNDPEKFRDALPVPIRPNQLGLTICEILKVDGQRLHLKGLDAVHGTAVLDIKPWVREFGPRGDLKQPLWFSELMEKYWA